MNSTNSDDIPRHSFEEKRNEYHDEECSTCMECGEPITPLNDGHNDECPIYKSLIANVQGMAAGRSILPANVFGEGPPSGGPNSPKDVIGGSSPPTC